MKPTNRRVAYHMLRGLEASLELLDTTRKSKNCSTTTTSLTPILNHRVSDNVT
jgi:hypothetical protein